MLCFQVARYPVSVGDGVAAESNLSVLPSAKARRVLLEDNVKNKRERGGIGRATCDDHVLHVTK